MVRNIIVFGGSSHPQLNQTICDHLGLPPGQVSCNKFAVGETSVEIGESVRGKDVYIIQSGGGKVNDHLLELLVIISACKTASAKRVTAVLPLFPYSRQSDIPYNKAGAPFKKGSLANTGASSPTDASAGRKDMGNGVENITQNLAKLQTEQENANSNANGVVPVGFPANGGRVSQSTTDINGFAPRPGYRQWVAQAGTLVADLLTCAGADHIITMDLHDPQYQGFFDIPVDNLYGRPLLKKYIQQNVDDYKNCVVVSPDAGGAKRATAIADSLGIAFALIHKERRPTKITDRQNATMMLVGDVKDRTAILVDDLADTSNTITRAARLLKKEGASKIYALITHGLLSGDAIERINESPIDKIVVTNTVAQGDHVLKCPKLEVLEVGHVFAEAIRRVHHGESISVLFQYD